MLQNNSQHFLNEHSILSKKQISFLPKHRTTDHIHHIKQKIGRNVSVLWTLKRHLIQFGTMDWIIESSKMVSEERYATQSNPCTALKNGDKHTDFFTQRRGVCQGCNIYLNQLALQLDQSTAPGCFKKNNNASKDIISL